MFSLMIVEPNANGHRMQYVRRIAQEATRQSIRVSLLTAAESLEHPAYLSMQKEVGNTVETNILSSNFKFNNKNRSCSLTSLQYEHLNQYRRFFRNLTSAEKPDFVFVPFLDHFDKAIAVLGSPFGDIPWGGLSMQYKFHYKTMGVIRPISKSDKLKEFLYTRLLKNKSLHVLFTIDEPLYEYTCQRYPLFREKICYTCEPVDISGNSSRALARSKWGIEPSKSVILVYGMLTARKGIKKILEAVQNATVPNDVCLFFAGPQDVEIRELLTCPTAHALRAQGNLIEVDRFLVDEEEYQAFKAANIVWLGYQQFYGMSAVLIQSGRMGLPVIACQEGIIGWLTRKYNIGLLIDDAVDAAQAITILTTDSKLAGELGARGNKLSEAFSSTAFAQDILSSVNLKLTI